MDIEKILSDAPEGATHYASKQYIREEKERWNFYRKSTGWHPALISNSIDNIQSLSDLREIQRLRDENEALTRLLKKIQVEGGLGVARHREIDRAINRQTTKGE